LIAKELISHEVSPLMTSDTGEEAITMMSIYHVKHLPIVNNEQLLGMVSEDDIYSENIEEAIGSYQLTMRRPYAKETDHLFEVMSKMAEYKLTVIPVVDEEDHYKGLITMEDLVHFYASSFSFTESGSIIVIETTRSNYSLAEISRIVEGENAAILSTFLTSEPTSQTVQVTLKLNKQEVQAVIASLSRFEYTVRATFSEVEYIDDLKERYDSLMSYLNV